MFILIGDAGRSIMLSQNPTTKECAEAEAIVRVDRNSVTIIKNRGFGLVERAHLLPSKGVQICGHPLTSIVSSDEGTHYCRECEEEK